MARVIFLAGLGRSGTTLLERALGELPGVQPLGEVIHLWRRSIVDDELCGCGDPFSRCPYWRAVGERAFGGWENVDVASIAVAQNDAIRLRHIPALAHGRGSVTEAARVIAEHHRRIYEAASALTGAAAVVDSSKHPSLAYALRSDRTIDLCVVHVVRDSRGVAYSWTKQIERPEARNGGSARWITRYTPTESAILWSAHNASTAMLRALGTRVMLVRYESFVRQPKTALAAIARFAHLDVDDGDLGFVSGSTIQLDPTHTASGNPLRFTSGTLEIRADDAWRSLLPFRQRLLVSALTYPQLAYYGFLNRPRGEG